MHIYGRRVQKAGLTRKEEEEDDDDEEKPSKGGKGGGFKGRKGKRGYLHGAPGPDITLCTFTLHSDHKFKSPLKYIP